MLDVGSSLGLSVNLNNKNSYVNFSANKQENNIKKTEQSLPQKTLDKSCDGKFSTSIALKNFAKGFVSPITNLFSSFKNLAIGLLSVVGGIALITATGGIAAPLFVAAGIGFGVFQAGKALVDLSKAQNGDDIEKAFYDVGGATSTIGLSVLGAKSSLKQAGINTEKINFLTAVKKCFTNSKNLTVDSLKVFKSGYYKTNIENAIRIMKNPKTLIKFSKEFSKEAKANSDKSINAIKEILPDEFKVTMHGGAKGEVSIYNKLDRKAIIDISSAIKNIKNNTKLTNSAKRQKISVLLKKRKLILSDKAFARKQVGDLYRARIGNVKQSNVDDLVNSLLKASKEGKIKIVEIENYSGVNPKYSGRNKAYFSTDHIKKLEPFTNEIKNNAFKDSGYTATQLKIKPKNGQIVELQVRGQFVDDVANWEHFFYDTLQNKDPSKGNNAVGIVLAKIKKTFKALSPKQKTQYQKYIYDNYIYAQAQELGQPIPAPQLPESINPILSAKNLGLLYEKTGHLKAGIIKTPLNLSSESPIIVASKIAGKES